MRYIGPLGIAAYIILAALVLAVLWLLLAMFLMPEQVLLP